MIGEPEKSGGRSGPPKKWVTVLVGGLSRESTLCSFKCAKEFLSKLESLPPPQLPAPEES